MTKDNVTKRTKDNMKKMKTKDNVTNMTTKDNVTKMTKDNATKMHKIM